MNLNFEWDRDKAANNFRKHGVSFEEAAEIFLDPLQLSRLDDEHSDQEECWITLGAIKNRSVKLIVHTFLEQHDNEVTIRVISARAATKHEQRQYEEAS